MQNVKKAIIPAAGLGTRFLPATKTVPKEMLTIVDAPIILYVIEEAVAAGIEDIVLVAGRGKHAIEDFFDTSYELEDKLAKEGKLHLLDRLIKIRDNANIISIRQKQALGLGHAVLCGSPIVGKEPFAVLLGDEITIGFNGEPNVTSQLVNSFENTHLSAIAIMHVQDSEISKYGIAEVENTTTAGLYKVKSLIEKPKLHQTQSRWALPGRYVFESEIFDILKSASPGLNGEIQLTDSMRTLCGRKGMNALTFTATRFDAGDKLGYLQANLELGLKNPELAKDLQSYILALAERLKIQ
ncbi:MAG: UTP--glucose-1-phosphate uridylyltransferase GalU [Pseudobdellovibrionaceae bacterium]